MAFSAGLSNRFRSSPQIGMVGAVVIHREQGRERLELTERRPAVQTRRPLINLSTITTTAMTNRR